MWETPAQATFLCLPSPEISAAHKSGQALRFAGASLAYWPAVLLVIALAVLCAAWIPQVGAPFTATHTAVLLALTILLTGLGLYRLDNRDLTGE